MSEARYFDPELQEYEGFVIDSDSAALWALRKIEDKRAEIVKHQKFYAMQLQKLQDNLTATEAFFFPRLREFFDSAPKHETKTASSYKLPDGFALKMVKPKQTYIHDDEQLLTWAQESAPELVKTKQSFDWSGLKTRLKIMEDGRVMDKETGEVMPAELVYSDWKDAEFQVVMRKDDD